MTEPPKTKNDQKARREARRAVALRENLKRRKAQARGRVQSDNAKSGAASTAGGQSEDKEEGGNHS